MNGKTNVTVSGGNDSLGGIIPLNPPTAFVAKGDNAKCLLTWTDPRDKYATPEGEQAQDSQQLVSLWDHTVLVRKIGSQPAGPHDGIMVVSSSVRNQYQSTTYIDAGLINDTIYHYGVFAYNTDGVASEGTFASATPIAGTHLSQLSEGTIIKINENGIPIEFYLAKHNYEEALNGSGRVLCVRKDVYAARTWDSAKAFIDYNILSRFSAYVQGLIGTTKYLYYEKTNVSWQGAVNTVESSAFMLSLSELGISDPDKTYSDGSRLSIASTLFPPYIGDELQSGQWVRSKTDLQYGGSGGFHNISVEKDYTDESKWVARSKIDSATVCFRPCFTLPSTALVDPNLNLIES